MKNILSPFNAKTKTQLPNPFRTVSSYLYPRTFSDVLTWAEYLWERNPKYKNAIKKVVSYFVSGLAVKQKDPKQQVDSDALEGFHDVLTNVYDLLPLTVRFGEQLAAMGNVFVCAERLFSRELLCTTEGCTWQMHLKNLRKGRDYEWDGHDFTGTCPMCRRHVKYKIKDVKTTSEDGRRLRFVFRSAEDMHVQYNRLTGTYKYLYRLPDDIADAIRRGDTVYLEDSPKVFIDAAVDGEPYIEFPDDMFISCRTETLPELDKRYKGWGMPLFMSAFDTLVRLQSIDKFNEAVIFDYLVPTRIISPEPANLKAGIDDPNRMPMSGATFRNYMSGAFAASKTNPARTIVSPVPVSYQRVGGDADLVQTDLQEYQEAKFLSDASIPQEFKQSTFQVVAPTMGLRMFERQWMHFGKGLGKFVRWASAVIADAHQFENMVCDIDTTSFVEDDMNKQTQLGLMQAGVIARTNVLKTFGIDFEDDVRLKIKEQELQDRIMLEQQKKQENSEMTSSVLPPSAAPGIGQAQMNIQMMQQQAAGGEGSPEQPAAPMQPQAPAGAGSPMPFNTGASQSASLEQLFQDAQNMAQQLYNAPPQVRRQQLIDLKSQNPEMHAQVMQMLRDMEQQVASEAVMQSKQPQQ